VTRWRNAGLELEGDEYQHYVPFDALCFHIADGRFDRLDLSRRRIAERRGRRFKIWAWIAAMIGPLAASVDIPVSESAPQERRPRLRRA